jgi:large subunit ribosomal protein L15
MIAKVAHLVAVGE